MKRFLLTATLTAGFLIVAPDNASEAQTPCEKRADTVVQLQKRYRDYRVFAGGVLLEAFASPSGTFSILVTRPNGIRCLIAAGHGWTAVKPKLPKS